MTVLKKILSMIMAAVAVVFVLIAAFDFIDTPDNESIYTLKADDNNVALYAGEQMVERFDGIVISNLPATDRQRLKEGIEFSTIEEARRAAEDYDG